MKKLQVIVQNVQTEPCVLQISVDQSPETNWLTVDPSSATIGPGKEISLNIFLNSTNLTVGNYTSNLLVSGNDPDNPVDTVKISLTIIESPEIVIIPDTLRFNLKRGQVDSSTFSIKNEGSGILQIWSIEEEEIENRERSPSFYQEQKKPVFFEKGASEPTFGRVERNSGGPDSFGYSWIDSDETNGPLYQFRDISLTGTPLVLEPIGSFDPKDEGMAKVDLPFKVKFYGQFYNQIWVSSNGLILFDLEGTNELFKNQPIPVSDPPRGIVAPYWDDLYGSAEGEIYTQQVDGAFIIQWHNWGYYPEGTEKMIFQVVFFENSASIHFVYERILDNCKATIGIENMNGTVGLQIAYNQQYAHDHLLVCINKDVGWLSEWPVSGTVNPGDSLIVKVKAEASDLMGGEYLADIVVLSNDLRQPRVISPRIIMKIPSVPKIVSVQDTLYFGTTFTGVTSLLPLTLLNEGTAKLSVFNITSSNSAFVVDTTYFYLDMGQQIDIGVQFFPLKAGIYEGWIVIQSDDPEKPLDSTKVIGIAVEPPQIEVSPNSISQSILEGDSLDVTIKISNLGGSNLVWSASLVASPQAENLNLPEQLQSVISGSVSEGMIKSAVEKSDDIFIYNYTGSKDEKKTGKLISQAVSDRAQKSAKNSTEEDELLSEFQRFVMDSLSFVKILNPDSGIIC